MVKLKRKRNFELTPRGKKIPLNPQAIEAFERQRERFIQKFGREPTGNDPIFFDPDADTPQPLKAPEDLFATIAEQAGLPPEIVYAVRKTQRLVTEENSQYLTDEELQEWEDAIAEFQSKN